MSRILIDDREYEVDPRHNLLQAILSLGLDLPYFCWHPALGSVGSCRQCAVLQYQDENDSRGRLVVACMTPVQEGMRIGLEAAQAHEFRAGVIEALMTNHPHDCPVCEEGGECHLQDMTEMSGHTFRRYPGLKRTHRNQYLGPFINHEMNRCIACYRCVRYYRDYAGGNDLGVQAAHNHVYFGRQQDGVLESPFSGNLVEVCPTGVFTDRTYSRHFSRKWDQQSAPSVCVHCAVGCNHFPAERYGRIIRVSNRFNARLNGYFLCDRGRFGYDFQNQPRPGEFSDSEGLLDALLERIADPAQTVFAVGSPRASLENNFALATLAGPAQFYAGVGSGEWRCLQQYLRILAQGHSLATPDLIEQCDAALILGEDIGATAPRVALSLRQLIRNCSFELAAQQKIAPWQDAAVRGLGQWQRSPLWQLVPCANALGDISAEQCYETPAVIAQLSAALADLLEGRQVSAHLSADQRDWIGRAAAMLRQAQRPLLVCGCGLVDDRLLASAARITAALKTPERAPQLYIAALESNSVGLAALCPRALDTMFEDIEAARRQGRRCTLVVLENDLDRRLQPELFARLKTLLDHWLVLDCLETPSTRAADAALPAPTAFEQQGSLVNASAMLQRYEAVMAPGCPPPWRRFAAALGHYRERRGELTRPGWIELRGWRTAGQLRQCLARQVPALAAIERAGVDAELRLDGRALARQSARYSGRTAIHAAEEVREMPSPVDADSPFRYSMEGAAGQGGSRAFVWAPGWNSAQALNRFQQEVGGDWQDNLAPALIDAEALELPPGPRSSDSAPAPGTRTWLPRYEVFAGEPLSDAAGAVSERAGDPVLVIDRQTAGRLELENRDSIELHYRGRMHTLYVHIDPSLPPGCIAVPQRAGFWRATADSGPVMELRPARSPLPKPPQLIASDREAENG
ncbi:NADH-quinone oxidoreductase [Marinobacterium nitratireducens]|uniref:NADH-quinone oxidoreductase subunit G n=2 Tax=Marinobacterium nitratireducens TaxID=518897 RepID=A0A917ZBA3_9GAMM|nr:NADH-quinone oxidoreductase [Marinobacterium nitratireducens]